MSGCGASHHCTGSRLEIEPDTVAQADPVDHHPGWVADDRRKGVSLDRAHPKPGELVEAQVADVGSSRRDREGAVAACTGEVDCRLDQRAADATAPVVASTAMFLISLVSIGGVDQLQMSDDPLSATATRTSPASMYASNSAVESSASSNSARSSLAWAREAFDANRLGSLRQLFQSDHGTIPRSGRAGSSNIARYSIRWPSGSRK